MEYLEIELFQKAERLGKFLNLKVIHCELNTTLDGSKPYKWKTSASYDHRRENVCYSEGNSPVQALTNLIDILKVKANQKINSQTYEKEKIKDLLIY